jgi:hypothetical protein
MIRASERATHAPPRCGGLKRERVSGELRLGGYAQLGVPSGTGSGAVLPVGGYAAFIPIGGPGIVGGLVNATAKR